MRFILVLLMATLTPAARGACVAESPEKAAEWIFNNQHDFYASGNKELDRFISRKLYGLLERDWQCQSGGDVCTLDGDPWIDAQDGEAFPPIRFALVSVTKSSAVVNMNYLFGWRDAGAPKPVPKVTQLKFVRAKAGSCWLLDDIIGPNGMSLQKLLASG